MVAADPGLAAAPMWWSRADVVQEPSDALIAMMSGERVAGAPPTEAGAGHGCPGSGRWRADLKGSSEARSWRADAVLFDEPVTEPG